MTLLVFYAGVVVGVGAMVIVVLIDTIRTARRFRAESDWKISEMGYEPGSDLTRALINAQKALGIYDPPVARPNPAARNIIG